MAASDHSLHPILMFVTDQQEIRIRQLFQQCGWTCQLKVLTSRHLNIIKTLGDCPIESTLYTVPEDRNVLGNFTEFEFGRENGEKSEKGIDVINMNIPKHNSYCDEKPYDGKVSKQACTVEKSDYSHIFVKTEQNENTIIVEKQTDASERHNDKMEHGGYIVVKTEVIDDGYDAADVSDTTLKDKVDYSTDKNNFESNDDAPVFSDIMAQMIEKHCHTIGNDGNNTTAFPYENSHCTMEEDQSKETQQKQKNAEEKMPVDIYNDPFIEQLMKYLQSSELTRPFVTSLMLRSCCLFLLEKDQSFMDWCKSKIDTDKIPDWKSRILEIAFKSDQVLLDVCIDRLKHIVEASVNHGFVDYLSNFLVTAKQLSFENTTERELTYQDVAKSLLNKYYIQEPNTDFISYTDMTFTSIPYNAQMKLAENINEDNISKDQCQHCPRKIRRGFMAYHVSRAHPKHASHSHQCFTCKELFQSSLKLEQHGRETKHKTRFPVDCPMCGKTMADKDVLAMHLRNVHGKDPPKYCEICKKESNGQNRKCLHMENYKDTEPHACDVCGKVYKSKRYMASHRKRHTDALHKHKCGECGKGFMTMHLLSIHTRVHTGEKPYKCPHCDYRCAFQNNLPKHIKIHQKNGTDK